MMKKFIYFLIVTTIFLMASCGTSALPQKSYVSQMEPAIEKLSKWQDHYIKFETLLTEPISASSGGGMSRLEMIELYNMATEYKITREDYVNMGFMPLDDLVGESTKVAKE